MKKIKIGQLSEKEKQNAVNEIRILASIDSPYIVSYKDAFYEASVGCLCIIMDFAEKGDLLQLIRAHKAKLQKIEEREIWRAINHITSGNLYLNAFK